MRQLYFLLPGTSGKFACGGLWAELKTLKLAQQICGAEVVTYRQREPETLFLPEVLQQQKRDDVIFVVSWGFDVAGLVAQLQGYQVVYHAHSAGYRLRLPANIPIITVSRNTLGYWGQQAPHSLIYYLPNQIADEFYNYNQPRDIDVLVQARKSSEYLLQALIPALQSRCRVHLVNSFVEDLPGLFNRAKVYLYDSAEYWAMQSVSEGFGLQPLEAMACGCQVFSSVNGGLSDYLDPGFNCYKIAAYSQDYDMQRILNAVHSTQGFPEFQLDEYRSANILHRLQIILTEINQFFDHPHSTVVPELTPFRLTQLRAKQLLGKIKQRYFGKS
jgi:glycosyltransferase involved in cell wall biosynthesis